MFKKLPRGVPFIGLYSFESRQQFLGWFERVREIRVGRCYLLCELRLVSARPLRAARRPWLDLERTNGGLFEVALFNRWYLLVSAEIGRHDDGTLMDDYELEPELA